MIFFDFFDHYNIRKHIFRHVAINHPKIILVDQSGRGLSESKAGEE
jgi:hypothetical protein